SPSLTVGIVIAFIGLLLMVHGLASLPWPLWITSLTVFVVAWIGQFVGHALEGKRPSFFKDVQFLLIGPLWLLASAYRRLGLRY
ncbi:MAG TPA: Mpo1-like protein, partial [Steroidobacteraceae bacterium]|nr:Mpo1-like protein [Steroidobacteraceae bacterium]